MSKQPLIDQLDIAINRILIDPDVELLAAEPAVRDLLEVARDLRNLPRPDLKARIARNLERKTAMTTAMLSRRPDFRTVTPYLLPPSADLLEFLQEAFGGVLTERQDMSPERFHAEMRIGNSMVMIGGGSERSMPVALQLYVPNVDEVYNRALSLGAKILNPIVEAHGDRFGCLEDPAGNQWYISTRLGGHYIPEGQQAITLWFHPANTSKFIEFMKRAFRAEELMRHDSPKDFVLHAKLTVGDSVVAMSEPQEWWKPTPSMIYLYVPNVDELYQQALSAGATSISAPADQTYGDRTAGVQDDWGNMWYMATPLG